VVIPNPQVRFSRPDYHAGEGDGSATITVERPDHARFITADAIHGGDLNSSEFGNCMESPNTTSVGYATADGGATAGSDYTATSGVLEFGPTDTSRTFSVPVSADTAAEGPESVDLSLSRATGAVLGSPNRATLTIDDDRRHGVVDSGDHEAPTVSGARIGRRFRIGSLLPQLLRLPFMGAARVRTGATISFTLSEAARSAFTFARRSPGRRAGRRCVKTTRRNKRAHRCVRRTPAGSFALSSRQGANQVRFQGRIGRKVLRPGRYALALTATDAAGNRSNPAQLAFTLLPPRRRR
jgi:hypothetical protein